MPKNPSTTGSSQYRKYVRSAIKHQKIITLIPSINEVFAIVALCVVLLIELRSAWQQDEVRRVDGLPILPFRDHEPHSNDH